MDSLLKQAGFDKAAVGNAARLVMAVDGADKCGKTHFALGAPGPTAYFNTDVGLEGVVEKFVDQKEILVYDVERPSKEEQADFNFVLEWRRFLSAYHTALESKSVRTVVFDTATEVWELLRMAYLGKLTQVMPVKYTEINGIMRDVIRLAYRYDKNLILLHYVKKSYANDKWNGSYERAGFSSTGHLVQLNIRAYYDKDEGEFGMRIENCRQNAAVAGMELTGPMCGFPFLASIVLPHIPADHWS